MVAGGSGLIGRQLVGLLNERGAKVHVVSLDDDRLAPPECQFLKMDLTEKANCLAACKDIEVVFNLLCAKGSPQMSKMQPASFFVPIIQLSINLMEAARICGVERYLFASSLAVYPPAEIFHEDDVWLGDPSPNDRFAGWAKRMGELQAEAYAIVRGFRKPPPPFATGAAAVSVYCSVYPGPSCDTPPPGNGGGGEFGSETEEGGETGRGARGEEAQGADGGDPPGTGESYYNVRAIDGILPKDADWKKALEDQMYPR